MIWSLVTIFLLQVFSTAINNLKTIFMTKGVSKPAYLLTFIDAISFAWGMRLTVSGDGFLFLIVYAVGKTVGAIIGDQLEKKLAIGTLEVTMSAKYEKAVVVADYLRDLGYTVNTRKVHGFNGNDRYEVYLLIKRKEFKFLKDTLERLGYDNMSMVIADVNRVTGKIQTSRQK